MDAKAALKRLADALASMGTGETGAMSNPMAALTPRTPPATVAATPPPLPGYDIPGMGGKEAMPPMAAYGAPTPQMAPVTASAPPVQAPAAPQPAMPPPETPPAPEPQPDVRTAVAQALMQMKGKGTMPPGWAVNFGNYSDQQS